MAAVLLLMTAAAWVCEGAKARFDGVWTGMFYSQPTELASDGSYSEHRNRFQIQLREHNDIVKGKLRIFDGHANKEIGVQNGKRFGKRACFDVILGSDMRWCVYLQGRRLKGSWSTGPEGGTLLDGAGPGARLFGIDAVRAK